MSSVIGSLDDGNHGDDEQSVYVYVGVYRHERWID